MSLRANVIHKPLSTEHREIRLLDVQPSADAASTIHGHLRNVILPATRPSKHEDASDRPADCRASPYETISYAWGDPRQRAIIYIDDQPLDVIVTAHQAIRRMRHTQAVRTLWIDSVCINQDDDQERSHQVGIMGDVYAHSTCNLVWLGESDEFTAKAIESISAIYDEILETTGNLRDWRKMLSAVYAAVYPGRDAEGNPSSRECFPLIKTAWDLPATVEFYSRPWFSRLWVLQEVATAPRSICFCGKYSLPLLHVLRPVVWMLYNRDVQVRQNAWPQIKPAFELRQCVDPIDGFLSDEQGWDLPSVFLHLTGSFRVTVPHDRVYALLGLAPLSIFHRIGGERLVPDYARPFLTVLRDATAAALQIDVSRDNLGDINHASLEELISKDIASWIPPSLYDPAALSSLTWNTSADRNRPSALTVDTQNPKVLKALGATVDSITNVSPPFPGILGLRDLDAWLRTCKQLAAHIEKADSASQTALATTLLGNSLRDQYLRNRRVHDDDVATFSRYWDAIYEAVKFPSLITNWSPPDAATTAVQEAFELACRHRRFFTTAAGRMGIGPVPTRIGDVVVVLWGQGYPLILRPSGEHHQLAGGSYVHGIMEGEALAGDVEEVTYALV